jgi:tRNA(fMet)-specific endonuclease VapC
MKRYMLDTNICIYIIKKKPMEVFNKFITKKIDDIYISSITLSELEYGVEKSTNKIKNGIALASFLAPVTVLPYASDIAKTYGEIRTSLEKKGTIIGAYDLMIAAHALAKDYVLVTNNLKEFKRVDGLCIENWVFDI